MDGSFRVPHAWHFDEILVAGFHQRWSTERRVIQLQNKVPNAKLDRDGEIQAVKREE
ncbi:MAG: tryptophan 7-halogenase [Prochlorococcaceae cyanobacterium]